MHHKWGSIFAFAAKSKILVLLALDLFNKPNRRIWRSFDLIFPKARYLTPKSSSWFIGTEQLGHLQNSHPRWVGIIRFPFFPSCSIIKASPSAKSSLLVQFLDTVIGRFSYTYARFTSQALRASSFNFDCDWFFITCCTIARTSKNAPVVRSRL